MKRKKLALLGLFVAGILSASTVGFYVYQNNQVQQEMPAMPEGMEVSESVVTATGLTSAGMSQETLETLETELESLNRQLTEAQAALEKGTLEAESIRKKRAVKSENAQEIYEVAAQKAEFETQNAKEDYESAQARLEELETYLQDQVIVAQADGVVTDVPISVGDSLVSDTELISYNSYEEVTITLTVEEADLDAAALGSSAEIAVAAFPDEIFEGTVTKIGDAQINSNTNTTVYEVVVTITKNASKLYEGMTAEVTFHRQSQEGKAS